MSTTSSSASDAAAPSRQVGRPRDLKHDAALVKATLEPLSEDGLMLVGAMAYRNLIRNDPPPGPDLPPRIVDDVLVALAPRPASPEDA